MLGYETLSQFVAFIEWLHIHRLFQDFFVLFTIKLHCMGDFPKYWVDRIEWLGYATNASQLISCIQVSIAMQLTLQLNKLQLSAAAF